MKNRSYLHNMVKPCSKILRAGTAKPPPAEACQRLQRACPSAADLRAPLDMLHRGPQRWSSLQSSLGLLHSLFLFWATPETRIQVIWQMGWSNILKRERIRLQCRRQGFNPWFVKIPWRRKWQPTPVFLPEKSHWQRSLAGYSPWCCKESDTM